MCLHLNVNEKQIKNDIETLLESNTSLNEALIEEAGKSEILCFDHFQKILHGIDLQRERLKDNIDDLSMELIDEVKVVRFKCLNNFKFDCVSSSFKHRQNT